MNYLMTLQNFKAIQSGVRPAFWGALMFAALLVSISTLPGCGGGGSGSSTPTPTPTAPTPPPPPPPPPADPEFDTTAMLTNFADNIIARNYQALNTQASAFAAEDGALATLCNAIGGDGEQAAREGVLVAWRSVMDEVQKTEMHVIGPALANNEALRHRVMSYAGSRLSTCGVDQSAALVANDDPDFSIQSRSANQRGYGAIEYLLFNESLTHSCAAQVPATSGWNDLADTTKKSARCELAQIIASDAATAAELLSSRWTEFRTEFLETGNTGNTLQLITEGIFAIDTLTKDQKLGIPMGIHDGCSKNSCPDNVESKYTKQSLANIRANVVAFQEVFQGLEGLGFDDLINDKDFEEVSTRFVTNLNAVITAIDAAQATIFDEATGIDNEAAVTSCTNAFVEPDMGDPNDGVHACRVTGLLKRVTDDLKIDFVTIVGVTVPGSAQSDND